MEYVDRYSPLSETLIGFVPDWAFDLSVYVNMPDIPRDAPYYCAWLDYEQGCYHFNECHIDIREVHFWKLESADHWQHHFEYKGDKYIVGFLCTYDGDECLNDDGNNLFFQPQWLEHDDRDIGPDYEWKLLAAIHRAVGFSTDRLEGAKSW